MTQSAHILPSDYQGYVRLAVEATAGITDLIEAVHSTIAQIPGLTKAPENNRTRGITGLVYGTVRGITRLAGGGMDAALGQFLPTRGERRAALLSSRRWPCARAGKEFRDP